MLVPIEILQFSLDVQNGMPLILMRETIGLRQAKITCSPLDINAIAMALSETCAEGSLSVDLAKTLCLLADIQIKRIIIVDCSSALGGARIEVMAPSGATQWIVCRYPDAFALALRTKKTLYISEALFLLYEVRDLLQSSDAVELQNFISSRDTLEFGTYYQE